MTFRFLSIILTLSAISSAALAEIRFVTDTWRFEMRDKPCWDCRITRSLPSGTELTLVETDDSKKDWLKVRTASGLEGWMAARYLINEPTASSRLQSSLKNLNTAITTQELLHNQINIIHSKLTEADIKIEMIQKTSENGNVTIELPQVVGNLSNIGAQNKEMLLKNNELTNTLALRDIEIKRLKENNWSKYFTYGALTILAGIFLGYLLVNFKPRGQRSGWG